MQVSCHNNDSLWRQTFLVLGRWLTLSGIWICQAGREYRHWGVHEVGLEMSGHVMVLAMTLLAGYLEMIINIMAAFTLVFGAHFLSVWWSIIHYGKFWMLTVCTDLWLRVTPLFSEYCPVSTWDYPRSNLHPDLVLLFTMMVKLSTGYT